VKDASQQVLDRFQTWGGYTALGVAMEMFDNVEIFAAGGVVRDAYLRAPRPPKDFDIFLVGSDVDQVMAHLARHGHMVSGAFGSPEWSPHAAPDTECDVIPVDRFFNGLWPCRDMVDALNQFDFTGNAVAVNLRTGEVLDPQNGTRDLAEHTLRAVRFDYPDEPIHAGAEITRSAVLWWRLVHYAHLCSLVVEPVTLRWLRAQRHHDACGDAFARGFHPVDPAALAVLDER
jgi:hypothetical protein